MYRLSFQSLTVRFMNRVKALFMIVSLLMPSQAVSWLFAGLALALTAGRFWIRAKVIKSFQWDDAAHPMGLLLLLTQVSIVSVAASMVYQLDEYAVAPTGEKEIFFFLRLDLAGLLVAWSCVYAIKAAFLLLYRRIFQISKVFTRAWWITLAFVLVTHWILVAGSLIECGSASPPGHLGILMSHSPTYEHRADASKNYAKYRL